MHYHWKSGDLAEALRARSEPPMIARIDDGTEVLIGMGPEKLVEKAFHIVAQHIASMDRFGIDRALLSMQPGFGSIERLPVDESIPLVQAYNNGVSKLCREHPDRFSAVAALPLVNIAAAATEFERALSLPGMVGAMLPGDAFLTYENAQTYRPLLEVSQRHGALAFIHRARVPGIASNRPARDVDSFTERDSTLDMQSSLSSIMVTICLSDLLDDYPDAMVLTHNLGGNIPYEVERMDHRSEERHPGRELPSSRFRRAPVMLDCNSFGPRAIESAVEVFGAEKIVFGSDGTDFGLEWSLKAVNDAQIGDAAREAILRGNAAVLLNRLTNLRQAAE